MSQHPKILIYTISALILFLCSLTGSGQKIGDLKKQKERAEQEIALTNKMILETEQTKNNSLNQLLLIKKKISLQQDLIKNLNGELEHYSSRIDTVEQNIKKAEQELKLLKDEYAKIIYSAHKNKHGIDKWLFVFSAYDFNQAYRRMKYLQQYSDYRKEQVVLIEEKEIALESLSDSLSVIANDKKEVLNQVVEEKERLLADKQHENKLYARLQQRESELRKELRKKERITRQIKASIERILEEERKRKLAANKAGKTFSLTPEEQLVSDNFARNKGKLPWPTERGVMVSSYGEHAHPILKGIKTFNNGIDVSTVAGSSVRAVFSGEVRDVWSIQGRNMAVIIKHGGYFSVYQNLVDVKVKPGDKVETKELIGTIFTDTQDGNKTVLHLEIWKGSNRNNPYKWLAK
jgi:murein hydrolase activator